MSNAVMNTVNLTVIYKNENMVTGAINDFLNRNIAESTRYSYNLDICQFFGVNSVDEITDKMVMDVTGKSARAYFRILADSYSSSSVKRKISSMKDLFNFIKNDRVKNFKGEVLVEGYNVFENVNVSVSTNQYGSFTENETRELIKVAMKMDAVYFEMLVMTGVRKESIRELNINENFIQIDGEWCITGEDKGNGGVRKKYVKKIGEYLYSECKKLASENSDGTVFKMGKNSALNRLKGGKDYTKGYCYKIGISEEECIDRNLCLHSFKKTGIIIVKDESNGNIIEMMRQGNHSNPKYTTTTYINQEYIPSQDPNNMIKLRETDKDEELFNKLNGMDKWELRDILIGLCENNSGIKNSIMNRL